MINYSGHGWEGTNYNKNLDIKEIAKKVRAELKKTGCKFSVRIERYSGGRSLYITLLAAPFEAFTENADVRRYYMQVNHFHYNTDERITDEAKHIIGKAIAIASGFNYDDSDSMIDYFDTNFYLHVSIGDYDKPFQKIA